MLKHSIAVFTSLFIFTPLFGQSYQSATYSKDAELSSLPHGHLRVVANSPRPIYQSVSAISRAYGILVDYEDPMFADNQTYSSGGTRMLIGGKFVAVIPAPSDANSSAIAFTSLIDQFNRTNSAQFKVVRHSIDQRIDVIGVTGMQASLLDTRITLDHTSRTVDRAVYDIIHQVALKTGTIITRGGLMDNSLTSTSVTFSDEEMPARDFLGQALDVCEYAKIWVLAYEPTDGHFYLGIQGAIKMTGPEIATPIPMSKSARVNSH